MKVKLNIYNPLNFETDLDKAAHYHFHKCFKDEEYDEAKIFSNEFRNYLLSENYDGLMWKHDDAYTVIALHPEQITIMNEKLIENGGN